MKFDRILVGDCREELKNIEDNSIAACITDPPYNYEFIGKEWDAGEAHRRMERVQGDTKTLVKNIPYGSSLAGGVRNKRWYERYQNNLNDYMDWCEEWSREVYRVLKPGGVIACFNSNRTVAHVQVAFERVGFFSRDIMIYRRSSGIPKGFNYASKLRKQGKEGADQWEGWHSCFRNEWEGIVVAQKPLNGNYMKTVDEFGVGLFNTKLDPTTFQSNIIEGIKRSKNPEWNIHCTVKPLDLMEKLVSIFVPPKKGNIVLDPFAGSGTTLVAAKNLNISYLGVEIFPEYAEIAERRLAEEVSESRDVDLPFELSNP